MGINLQQFCGDDQFRSYLNKPFSHGKFTYATNGHIMVRVPRLPDVPEQTKTGNWEGPFASLASAAFTPLAHKPLPNLPAPGIEDCGDCEGRGTDHDCPECTCECDACEGIGKQGGRVRISTRVRGGIYDFRYVAMLLALPNVEIATATKDGVPLLFKFDGGFGALMPRTVKDIEHIEIEADKAA